MTTPRSRQWLVVGASGLVGGELTRRLSAHGERVCGTARTVLGDATETMDLSDRASIARVVDTLAPDVVVIASAWPHVDGCEADPERSKRENVDTVANLIDAVRGSQARIVFYSTDHVFDGRKGEPYVERDGVNPPSVYAKHKRQVEEMLFARGRSLVLRTAWVFGQEIRKKNFVYRVANMARAGEVLKVPVAQAGCPTWSAWLAERTIDLVNLEGVVHATGQHAFTKAEWARAIAESLGLPPIVVEEVDWKSAGQVAPRPERVELRTERFESVHPDVRSILQNEAAAFV